MWSDGIFGEPIDSALLSAAVVLSLVMAWQRASRFSAPRFPGALVVLWLIALIALPVPLYFSAGIGMWIGAILVESLGGPAYVGAAAGIVLTPPLVCAVALDVLNLTLTAPRRGP